jgi:hypothetical protein
MTMERRHGFFAALREEVARGLSPTRARRKSEAADLAAAALRFAGVVGCGEMLAPLMEGPDPEPSDGDGGGCRGAARGRKEGWGHWVRGQFARAPSSAAAGAGALRNDLRMLLGVLGAPLAPVHVCASEPLPHLSVKDTPIVSASLVTLLLCIFFVLFLRFCRLVCLLHVPFQSICSTKCRCQDFHGCLYPSFLEFTVL